MRFAAFVLLGFAGPLRAAEPPPLGLQEVLRSVETHYPALRALEEERRIAGGRLLGAMGAFDTNFSADSINQPLGTYENYRYSTRIDQAFPNSGTTGFLQYRGGLGDFPNYYGDRKTADGGEVRAGVNVPFARDREIDRRRAALQQAEIGVRAAEPLIARGRLDFQRAAARTYFAWIANGYRLKYTEELLRLAKERDGQIAKLIASGNGAEIARTDNAQNIAAREALLAEARLRFQSASVDLSLFLRDSGGQPFVADRDRLPAEPALPTAVDEGLESYVAYAVENRPEVKRIRLQRESAEVDLRLARNQYKPRIDGFVAGSQDAGYGKPSSGPNRLDRSAVEAGVAIQLPIQRRAAQGDIDRFDALVRQLARQEQMQRDMVATEVRNAFLAWKFSSEAYQAAARRVGLANEVAAAQRKALQGGLQDVLQVTLREQAAFEAELTAIGALFETLRSIAEFRTAMGLELIEEK